MFGGRQTLQGLSKIILNLNIYVDWCIGFAFGRWVPLGSVGSPVMEIVQLD